MAEQQEEVPCEQEVDDDDTDDTNKPNYKPPAQKSVKDILNADADDESLIKYKKSLLGDKDTFQELWPGEPIVIVRKMAIIIDEKVHAEVDLKDQTTLKNMKFTVEEGTEYKTRLAFNVQKEICSGLKLINTVKGTGLKKLFKGATDELMVGSYKPNTSTEDIHIYTSKPDVFPSGMSLRGEYKVESLFTDDDKNEICKWKWSFEIVKKDKS